MKKIFNIILSTLLVAMLLVGCSKGKYTNGNYEGVGRGASSDIKVSVEVAKGKIKNITLVDHKETKTLVEGVEDNIIPEVIENQGIEEVEAISGATESSNGVIEAITKALEQAKK